MILKIQADLQGTRIEKMIEKFVATIVIEKAILQEIVVALKDAMIEWGAKIVVMDQEALKIETEVEEKKDVDQDQDHVLMIEEIEALAKTEEAELKRVIDTEEEDHPDPQDLQDKIKTVTADVEEIEETEMTEDIAEEMIHVTKTNIELVDLRLKVVSVVDNPVMRVTVIHVLTKVSRDILVKTVYTQMFVLRKIKITKNIQILSKTMLLRKITITLKVMRLAQTMNEIISGIKCKN
jgi:hypothetical protein